MELNIILNALEDSTKVALLYMVFFWIIASLKNNNGLVDIGWGPGFAIIAWFSLIKNANFGQSQILLAVLVTIWALRLSLHIAIRNWNKPEDYRYVEMKKSWKGNIYLNAFFRVFLIQGLLMIIISSAFLFSNYSPSKQISALSIIGIIVWLIGFFFEAVGDWQLRKFTKNPLNKGKIMQTGLWRYTRHPNYFGESTVWWGIYLISIPIIPWWIGIITPLTITFLLLKVSGITMLEKKYENNREFLEYKKRTSAFFPLPPKQPKKNS